MATKCPRKKLSNALGLNQTRPNLSMILAQRHKYTVVFAQIVGHVAELEAPHTSSTVSLLVKGIQQQTGGLNPTKDGKLQSGYDRKKSKDKMSSGIELKASASGHS
jgi:hypothetical protein